MKIALIATLYLFCFALNVAARPISYSGGTTIMQKNGVFKNQLHIHYSPSYKYSIGYKGEYHRKDKIALNGMQLNNLLKRWNLPAAQGNIYLKSAIGNASQKISGISNNELYGFAGIAADFETRKYFVSYENKYYKSNGNIIGYFTQNARIGVAPYVANYGSLHSWIMIQATHTPEFSGDELVFTPLLRLFKGVHLAELGVSSNKRFLFNFIVRF